MIVKYACDLLVIIVALVVIRLLLHNPSGPLLIPTL